MNTGFKSAAAPFAIPITSTLAAAADGRLLTRPADCLAKGLPLPPRQQALFTAFRNTAPGERRMFCWFAGLSAAPFFAASVVAADVGASSCMMEGCLLYLLLLKRPPTSSSKVLYAATSPTAAAWLTFPLPAV
jgi:hypothetical protein